MEFLRYLTDNRVTGKTSKTRTASDKCWQAGLNCCLWGCYIVHSSPCYGIKYPWENNTYGQVTDNLQLLRVHCWFAVMQDGCILDNNTWELSVLMYWFISSYTYAEQIIFPHRKPDILQMAFPSSFSIFLNFNWKLYHFVMYAFGILEKIHLGWHIQYVSM